MKYFIILVSILTLTVSCSKDEFSEENEKEILKYIDDNNLDAIRSDSGLYYVINDEGVGPRPNISSSVTVKYHGYFTDGKTFDGNTATFALQNVIKGWTEGLTYIKQGGSITLLIPSSLGYGSSDTSSIPGGSVLVFDIDLVTVYY